MKKVFKSYFIGITGLVCGVAAFTIFDEISRHKELIQEGTYPIVNSVVGYSLLALVLGASGLVFSIKTLRYYTAGKNRPEELIDLQDELYNTRHALRLNPLIWILTLCFILGFLSWTIYVAVMLFESIQVTGEPGFSEPNIWKMFRPQVLLVFFFFATAVGMLIDYLNLWLKSRKA